MCVATLSNMSISEISGPIATRCCLKQHWGGVNVAMGLSHFFSVVFHPIHFILAGNEKIQPDPTTDCGAV